MDETMNRAELAKRVLQDFDRSRAQRGTVGSLDRGLLEQLALRLVDTATPMIDSHPWLNEQLAASGGNVSASAFYRFADRFQKRVAALEDRLQDERTLTNLEALSVPAVARGLELSPGQVQELIDTGKLASITLAGELRVPAVALAALLGNDGKGRKLRIARERAARVAHRAHPT
jgi:hypothetical protein